MTDEEETALADADFDEAERLIQRAEDAPPAGPPLATFLERFTGAVEALPDLLGRYEEMDDELRDHYRDELQLLLLERIHWGELRKREGDKDSLRRLMIVEHRLRALAVRVEDAMRLNVDEYLRLFHC